ncbi:MAG: aminoacyl--tRNA ligase-related protein, partial [Synechocystis sp.]|nr:aminoacyl--tRNA ligase-related protein [Synechocystis sp.]
MLDLKQIRENPTAVQSRLNQRGSNADYDLTPLLAIADQQKALESQRTLLQSRSNEIGKLIGQKIGQGADPKGEDIKTLREEGNNLKQALSELEPQEKTLKEDLQARLLQLPNLPCDTTPIGANETENVEVKRWGDDLRVDGEGRLSHGEIGETLGLFETERAVKVAQSRFVALMGAGAALERALINFMLDRQINAGYVEVMPPILVNSDSLLGTGQLPKFAEESFQCREDDLWLIPTAEVPVTNLYRDEILDLEQLPIKHCAYTPCFRREAG